MHIEYPKNVAREKILETLGTTEKALTHTQAEILDRLPDIVPESQLSAAIQSIRDLQPSQHAEAPSETVTTSDSCAHFRTRLTARLAALESEHQERTRILQWINKEGGLDSFLNNTLRVEGAAKELRDQLHREQVA